MSDKNVLSLKDLLSPSSILRLLTAGAKKTVTELKELNTLITQIGRENASLSMEDLDRLSQSSLETASRYGRNAADYLSEVSRAFRTGYQDAEGMAELSLALQNAGGVTAELASQLVTTMDRAYQLGGSVDSLTQILDGCSQITQHNDASFAQLAQGMSLAGSAAASLGVDAGETAAALGTMIAATHQGGAEAANAFNALLLSIGQVSDTEAGIDTESLARYEDACRSLGVSLKETRDGMLALRDPMDVLRELSDAYNALDDSDTRKDSLLAAVGGDVDTSQIDALLRHWDIYESMLGQYTNGSGSLAAAAQEHADSWEGSLNRLSNTWSGFVGNLADTDGVTAAIDGLNSLLSAAGSVTERLGALGTVGAGAGLLAGLKNVGMA